MTGIPRTDRRPPTLSFGAERVCSSGSRQVGLATAARSICGCAGVRSGSFSTEAVKRDASTCFRKGQKAVGNASSAVHRTKERDGNRICHRYTPRCISSCLRVVVSTKLLPGRRQNQCASFLALGFRVLQRLLLVRELYRFLTHGILRPCRICQPIQCPAPGFAAARCREPIPSHGFGTIERHGTA